MNAVVCAALIALLVPANTVGIHDNDTAGSVLHLLTLLPPGDVANSLLPAAELAVDKINAFLYLTFYFVHSFLSEGIVTGCLFLPPTVCYC